MTRHYNRNPGRKRSTKEDVHLLFQSPFSSPKERHKDKGSRTEVVDVTDVGGRRKLKKVEDSLEIVVSMVVFSLRWWRSFDVVVEKPRGGS